ncbi:hypothetical protein [Phycicoccus sp.]|uniref:hypothetical protein n=1 Tax=Phycicoccus sp. TaxID=1902410 RepID=UPI002BDF55AE|nr:hypothetical protein [Phycicoccus sp.]HMM96015.1 hypothetical protein [Phycicoccus sp.]
MRIEDVADELYALAPEDFTAARNARAQEAKAAGETDLAASLRTLRKPTAGAGLLNRFVRERGEEVEQVLELGARLRAAQGTLGAAELRALDAQRRALTRAVARQVADLARADGRNVSPAVLGAVEETLRSAIVDAAVGAAVASGLLTDTVSASGLEPVDLSRVVALGVDGPAPRRPAADVERQPDAAAVAAAEQALADAEESLRAARDAAEEARQRAVGARRRREEAEASLETARRRVAELEQLLGDERDAEDAARRAQLAATRDERSATEAVTRARHRLDAAARP